MRYIECLKRKGIPIKRHIKIMKKQNLRNKKSLENGSKKKVDENDEKEKAVFFDEFSVTTVTTVSYGWAKKNGYFEIKSSEKKRKRANGYLSVDLKGKTYFKFKKDGKGESVA